MSYEIITSEDGYRWLIRDDSQVGKIKQDILGANKRELYNLEIIQKYGHTEKLFIDVGAHVGNLAIRAADNFMAVHAFEANPFNFLGLMENIVLNEKKNVFAYGFALGDQAGLATVSDRGGGSKLLEEGELVPPTRLRKWFSEDRPRFYEVPVFRLDIMFPTAPVAVMKIDTEGLEEEVLKGARLVISHHKPVLLIETHQYNRRGEIVHPGQIQRIYDYLKMLGYNKIDILETAKNSDLHLAAYAE